MKIVILVEDGVVAGAYMVLQPTSGQPPEVVIVDDTDCGLDEEPDVSTILLEPIDDAPDIVRRAIS